MPLFPSGTIDITPTAVAALDALGTDLSAYLSRHLNGDWGEIDELSRRDNDYALQHNQPICSTYKLSDGGELLIFTPGDRSTTHVSLVSDRCAKSAHSRDMPSGQPPTIVKKMVSSL